MSLRADYFYIFGSAMRGVFAATAVVAALFAAAALSQGRVTSSAHFRMTVSVMFDGVGYEGSTVYRLDASYGPHQSWDSSGAKFSTFSDAIEIPVGEGRALFVLRRQNTSPPNKSFGHEYIECVPGSDPSELVNNLPKFTGDCPLAIHPRVELASPDGVLEPLPYSDVSGKGPRFTLLSLTATSTAEPLRQGS
jgi:hypothetical protein